MCGIYCSKDLSTFEVLDQANKKRGNFATGALIIDNNKRESFVIQKKDSIDWDLEELPTHNTIYLGHNQAPTSSERRYSTSTSHPFKFGRWVVAHNGILTNADLLKEDYIPHHKNPVDSSLIPAILNELEFNKFGPCNTDEEEVLNLLYVLERLQGTFAIWVYNTNSRNVYFARQGSTLFYKGTNVSSIKGRYYKEVSEGILYKLMDNKIEPIEGFIADSPFLTL